MASQAEETILTTFRDLSSGISTESGSTTGLLAGGQVEDVGVQIEDAAQQITAAGSAQTDAITANTRAVLDAQKSSSATQSDSGITAGSVLSTVFQSGFGVIPLISGLLGLFGGGSDPAPPPLVRYAPPASVSIENAQWGGSVGGVDFDQTGALRPLLAAEIGGVAPVSSASSSPPADRGGNTTTVPATITVQVQAIDSQSFLDHSQEIARAVRDAMLNLNAINDVVNDL